MNSPQHDASRPAAGGPVSQPNLGTRYGYAGSWGYQNDGAASASRDIGVLHVGARYYDPAIGRFIQRDRIRLLGGLNVYAYVGNAPSVSVDRTGLIALPTFSTSAVIGTLISITGGNPALFVRAELTAMRLLSEQRTLEYMKRLAEQVMRGCQMIHRFPLN